MKSKEVSSKASQSRSQGPINPLAHRTVKLPCYSLICMVPLTPPKQPIVIKNNARPALMVPHMSVSAPRNR